MNGNIKALDDVIREIVFNDDVSQLLSTPNAAHSYDGVVQFQVDECEDNGTSIAKEGFQIGEPFDGDIENAPILFLSSNPAFNFDEVSPRYFPDSGKIFMPAHVDLSIQDRVNIPAGNYLFEEVKSKFAVPQKEMSFDEIKEFLKTRIQTSPARNKRDTTLCIPLKDGGTVGVPYWTCVRNNTELLLPVSLKNQWTNLTPSQRVREIMKYAVCMEIVPFKSSGESGVENAKDTCWNNFTTHLLELSGASVIVLVGNKVLDSFTSHMAAGAKAILEVKNIYACRIGKKDRQIVKVDFAQGKMRRFATFFDSTVISQLQSAVKNAL